MHARRIVVDSCFEWGWGSVFFMVIGNRENLSWDFIVNNIGNCPKLLEYETKTDQTSLIELHAPMYESNSECILLGTMSRCV